jgi:hypothetical protein
MIINEKTALFEEATHMVGTGSLVAWRINRVESQ